MTYYYDICLRGLFSPDISAIGRFNSLKRRNSSFYYMFLRTNNMLVCVEDEKYYKKESGKIYATRSRLDNCYILVV